MEIEDKSASVTAEKLPPLLCTPSREVVRGIDSEVQRLQESTSRKAECVIFQSESCKYIPIEVSVHHFVSKSRNLEINTVEKTKVKSSSSCIIFWPSAVHLNRRKLSRPRA